MSIFDRIFGRKPKTPSTVRDFAKSEEGRAKLAELDAIIAANNSKIRLSSFVLPSDWPTNAYPIEDYDHSGGALPDSPFGEDILRPASRLIPAAFHGHWRSNLSSSTDVICANEILIGGFKSPVIAVREIAEGQIAVVVQQSDGKWLYALYYFGFEDQQSRIRNLEDYDEYWIRA
jgi:hypothetical protein